MSSITYNNIHTTQIRLHLLHKLLKLDLKSCYIKNDIFRCEKFISMCDIHGDYLFASSAKSANKKCCGKFFNPKPFFVNTGTCFTSYQEVWEKWPFTFSFLKMWLNVRTSISPGIFINIVCLN
jgi:hypothetical protein